MPPYMQCRLRMVTDKGHRGPLQRKYPCCIYCMERPYMAGYDLYGKLHKGCTYGMQAGIWRTRTCVCWCMKGSTRESIVWICMGRDREGLKGMTGGQRPLDRHYCMYLCMHLCIYLCMYLCNLSPGRRPKGLIQQIQCRRNMKEITGGIKDAERFD